MAKQLNQIEVDLNFAAHTEQAKKEIQQLQNLLNHISYTSNNDGITKNITKLKEASQAAQSLQRHINNAFDVNTGKLDLSKLDKSLKSTGENLTQLSTKLVQSGKVGQEAFMHMSKAISQANQPMLRINRGLTEMLTVLKNTARWQISSSILHGFLGTVSSAYHYAQDLNKSLNNIQIVTGQNADQMARFAEEANKSAKALSTTTTAYTNASLIYYQQGLNDKEVKERTDVTMKMANVTGDNAQKVSDQMTAVWNNFDDGSESLEHYADVMTALGAATASSTDEIATGLEKFAGIANTVGLSFDYATSALATVTAASRQSAEVVGTAFKTMFARIQGLKLGNTLEDGTTLNKYSEALYKVGINIKDQQGELKNMDTILDEMGSKWQILTKDQQVALAQTVAGTRQYTQLVTLMDNWGKMKENLGVAEGSEGTLSKQAAIYEESWEASSKRVKASLQGVYKDLIDDKFFISFNNGFATVIGGIDNFIKNIGGLKNVIIGITTLIISNFSHKIPEALETLKYNLTYLVKGSGEAYAKIQKDMETSTKEIFANNPNMADSTKFMITSSNELSLARTKLAAVSSKMSSSEKQMAETQLSLAEAQQEEIHNIKKKNEALQESIDLQANLLLNETPLAKPQNFEKQISTEERNLAGLYNNYDTGSENNQKILNDLNEFKEQYDAMILSAQENAEQLGAPIIKSIQAAKEEAIKTGSTIEEVLNKSGSKSAELGSQLQYVIKPIESLKTSLKNMHLDDSNIDIIQTKIAAIGALIPKTVKEAGNLEKSFANVAKATNKTELSSALESLLNDLTNCKIETKDYGKVLVKLFGSDASKLIAQIKELGTNTNKAAELTKVFKGSLEDFNPTHIVKTSEAIGAMGSEISSIAMIGRNLVSVFQSLSNPDISGWEKFTAILTSIGMTIPMVLSLLRSYGTLQSWLSNGPIAEHIEKTIQSLTLDKTAVIEKKKKMIVEQAEAAITQKWNKLDKQGLIIKRESRLESLQSLMIDKLHLSEDTASIVITKLKTLAEKNGNKVTKQQIVDTILETVTEKGLNAERTKSIVLLKILNALKGKHGGLLLTAGIGLIAGITVGIVKLFDALIITRKEAKKAISESNQELENQQQKLDEITNKLTSVKDKISEIQRKGKITLTDQKELNRLLEEEASLQNQYELQKKLTQVTAEESAKTFEKNAEHLTPTSDVMFNYFDKGYETDFDGSTYSMVSGGQQVYSSPEEFYEQYVKPYENYAENDNKHEKEVEQSIYDYNKQAYEEAIKQQIEEYKNWASENPEDFQVYQEGFKNWFEHNKNVLPNLESNELFTQYNDILKALHGTDYNQFLANQDNVLQSEEALHNTHIVKDIEENNNITAEEVSEKFSKDFNNYLLSEGIIPKEYAQNLIDRVIDGTYAVGDDIVSASIETNKKLQDKYKVVNNLKTGDTISPEDYALLDEEVQDYFTITEDGQYRLTENAKVFRAEVMRLHQEQISNAVRSNNEQISGIKQKKQDVANAIGDYYSLDDLTNVSYTDDAYETHLQGQFVASVLGDDRLNEIKGKSEYYTDNGDGTGFYSAEGFKKLAEAVEEAKQVYNGFDEQINTLKQDNIEAELSLAGSAKTLSEFDALNLTTTEARQSGLKLLALQYKDCSKELENYNDALASGNEEEIKERTDELRDSLDKLEKAQKHAATITNSKERESYKITNNLKTGDEISVEDYSKLDESLQEYFTLTEDGQYRLTENAKVFREEVMKLNRKQMLDSFLENNNQIAENEKKITEAENAHTYHNDTTGITSYYSDLSSSAEYSNGFVDMDQVGAQQQLISAIFGEETLNKIIGNKNYFNSDTENFTSEGLEVLAQKAGEADNAVDDFVNNLKNDITDLKQENEDLSSSYAGTAKNLKEFDGLHLGSKAQQKGLKLLASQYDECSEELKEYNNATSKYDKNSKEVKKATNNLRRALKKVEWDKFTKDALKSAQALKDLKNEGDIKENLKVIQKAFSEDLGFDVSLDQLYQYKDDIAEWGAATEEQSDDIATRIYSALQFDESEENNFANLKFDIDTEPAMETLDWLNIHADSIKQMIEDNPPVVSATGEADFSGLLAALLESGATASQVAAVLQAIGQTDIDMSGWGDAFGEYDLDTTEGIKAFAEDLSTWKGGLSVDGGIYPSTAKEWADAFEGNVTGAGGGRHTSKNTSGGGGKKKKKKTSELDKEKIERYHIYNKSKDNIEAAQDRSSANKDQAFGLNKLKYLDEEIERNKELIELEKAHHTEVAEFLKKDAKLAESYGFTVDQETNMITNWESVMYKEREAYYKVKDDENASEEAIDAAEERWKHVKEAAETYEETVKEYNDVLEREQELAIDEVTKALERITTEIDIKVKLDDRELDKLNRIIKRLERQPYHMVNVMAALPKQADLTMEQMRLNQEGIDRIKTNAAGRELTENEQQQIWDYEDAIATGEDTLYELIDTVNEAITKEMDYFDERMEQAMGNLDSYSSAIDHYKSITKLAGRELKDTNLLMQLSNERAAISINHLTMARQKYEIALQAQQEIEREKNNATDPKEWAKDYEDATNRVIAAKEEMIASWDDSLQAALDDFESDIELITNKLKHSLSNIGLDDALKRYDEQKENNELYLSDLDKEYEISKLIRSVQGSIDDTDNIRGKQKLNELLGEINDKQTNIAHMSQYDLEYLQKKYDLKLAEIALEEAQNAKTTVRLSKDNEGNFGYVYTADEDNIADAQQNYEDKLHDLQKLSADHIDELGDKILQNEQQMVEELNGIDTTRKDYMAEVQRIKELYGARDQELREQFDRALENSGILFKDTILGSIETYNNGNATVMDGHKQLVENSNATQEALGKSYTEWQTNVDNAMKAAGTSMENFTTDVGNDLTNIGKGVEQLSQTTDAEVENMSGYIGTLITRVGEWRETTLKAIQDVIEARDKLDRQDTSMGESPSDWDAIDYSLVMLKTFESDPEKYAEAMKKRDEKLSNNNSASDVSTAKLDDILDKAKDHNSAEYQYVQDVLKHKKYFTSAAIKEALGYDTGGYTGKWGPEGKLAFLHQKELVLNAQDTSNFLSGISILREISKAINFNALYQNSKLGEISAMSTLNNPNATLDQNVIIHAEFPNVNDKYEIQEALNSLINQASQYANQF